MKQKNDFPYWIGLVPLAFFIMAITAQMWISPYAEIKEVPCFDRYGHEIQGVICEEVRYPGDMQGISLIVPIAFVFAIWMTVIYIVCWAIMIMMK